MLWEGDRLVGHLARANAHWRRIVDGSPALAIVTGPDTYVSPSWYASKAEHGKVVPTWNYSVVHLRGRVAVHDDASWVRELVTRLTDRHEQPRPEPWSVTDAPADYVDKNLRPIVGVELLVSSVEAKAKLSQNRSDEDRAGVAAGLAADGREPDGLVVAVTRVRERFTGRIAGVGSASGVRIVVGRWDDSPWGAFADVMVEDAKGHRVLLAPSERVRDFVAATYSFDEHVIEPVTVEDTADGWLVSTPSLSLQPGDRRSYAAGRRCSPRCRHGLATSPAWCTVIDPVARVVLRGVRTRGTAGNDRREWYGATSVVAVTAISGRWRGADLGALTPVDPPCRFGFSSTPKRPSVTSVVTTIERAG